MKYFKESTWIVHKSMKICDILGHENNDVENHYELATHTQSSITKERKNLALWGNCGVVKEQGVSQVPSDNNCFHKQPVLFKI